jgi:hypothetical protein
MEAEVRTAVVGAKTEKTNPANGTEKARIRRAFSFVAAVQASFRI